MSTYELFLVGHIGAAIAWIGAAFLVALLTSRTSLDGDAEGFLARARDAEWLGLRLFLPANLLTLVFGVLLVHEGGWGYRRLWIELGLGGLTLSMLLGIVVFAPGWAQVTKLGESRGARAPEIGKAAARLLLVGWIDLGLLAAVVWVMTVKPSASDVGALAVAAALVALGGGIGGWLARTAPVGEANGRTRESRRPSFSGRAK